jgi:hypothetical protein
MPDAEETPGVGIGNAQRGIFGLKARGPSVEGGVAFEQKFAEGVCIARTKCPGQIDFGAVFEARKNLGGTALKKRGAEVT